MLTFARKKARQLARPSAKIASSFSQWPERVLGASSFSLWPERALVLAAHVAGRGPAARCV